jgi:hypothetical protein
MRFVADAGRDSSTASRPWTGSTAEIVRPAVEEPSPHGTTRSACGEGVRSAVELVLVVSSNPAFESEMCALVEDARYRAEGVSADEPAWRALARTNPCIAICDFEDRAELVKPVAIQAILQSVPVLLLRRPDESGVAGLHAVAPGVLCAPIPMDAASLEALLCAILSPSATEGAPTGRAPMDAPSAERSYTDWLQRATYTPAHRSIGHTATHGEATT